MDITTRLVTLRERSWARRLVRQVLATVFHIDLPTTVDVGPGFRFVHRGVGTVIHPGVSIGRDVTVFHQVTIGIADALAVVPREEWPIVRVGDGATLFAGAMVIAPREGLTIGAGTQVGANSVLLCSTGPGEVWAGVPARRVR